ncbi:hypothetical protein H5410_056327 [Solanum commersonii]|uniref:Secreted protein n=1 Tax=Solanum commersonii TaxID=4109 RepID=A0A9J5WJZ2_SOLCO|nr:hypothetical protein H5410_056327 [Solanum commersonii]
MSSKSSCFMTASLWLSLVVLSLITELCKWAEVEVLLGDTWMEPKHQIFPIKMHGEGTIVKIKKRKVDSGSMCMWRRIHVYLRFWGHLNLWLVS